MALNDFQIFDEKNLFKIDESSNKNEWHPGPYFLNPRKIGIKQFLKAIDMNPK